MLRSIGLPEMMAIAAVAILLFGGKRVGELGKGMGDAIKGFRESIKPAKEAREELRKETGA